MPTVRIRAARFTAMPSVLAVRDPFADVKDTLSSWDKCMAKVYCKWPVIVAIIIGSLIVLSVVLCVARCICCGAELACCCFKCCTCCCPSGGGRRSKHKRMKSDPPAPSPYHPSAYSTAPPAPAPALNQQYRSHDTPAFRPSPFFNPAPTPVAAAKEEPQYARFDANAKPVNEDALPAMPSWNDAKDVHVEEPPEKHAPAGIELDRLDRNGSVTANSLTAAASGGARRSPGPGRSPMQRTRTQDSYGFPQAYQNNSFVSGAPQRSYNNSPMQSRPYGQQDAYGRQDGYGQHDAYGQQRQNSYDHVSPIEPSASSAYSGPDGYQHYDRTSPAPPSYAQQEQQYRRPSPARSPPPNPYGGTGYSAPQQQQQQYQEPTDIYHQSNTSAGPPRSITPGYAPSGSTRYEQSAPAAPSPAAYPGQQTYGSSETAYPGQQAYQAFNPGQSQGQQTSGVVRKPVDGSWKEN